MTHEPPQHLDPVATAKWAKLAPTLDMTLPGVVDALAAYATAWSRWTAAEQQVSTLGTVVKSPAGFPVANPYVGIAAAASRQLRQWGDVLRIHKRPGRKAEPESSVARILRTMNTGDEKPNPRRKATA